MSVRNIGSLPPQRSLSERFSEAFDRTLLLTHEAETLPGRLRDRLRPLLPERSFLRRARGDGLFVTDAPRHTPEQPGALLEGAGFQWEENNGCLTLFPDAAELTAFETHHPDPPDFFCETLLRFRGEPPCGEALRLFAVGVRLLEASTESERRVWLRRVRNLAAVSLRTGQGGAYACALIAHILSR